MAVDDDARTTVEIGKRVKTTLLDSTRMQIVFRDLEYSVKVEAKAEPPHDGKKAKKTMFKKKEVVARVILKKVTGVIQPGKLTYVMGASGAGKTTFLNTVSGYPSGGAEIGGSVTVNGEPMPGEKMRKISGYVHQEDIILGTMTVREVLTFCAQLRLPPFLPEEEKISRALEVADLLLLRKSLDSLVGTQLIKGISGGEKRRLSLGMQMITNPSILFLDEPTSGLDSYTAYKVSRIMANLAHAYHRTVVCTIHQPSTDIFFAADDLMVLAEGEVLYMGEVNKMVTHFEALGYPCPTYSNPADHLFRNVLHEGGGEEDGDVDAAAVNVNEAEAATKREEEQKRMRSLLDSWTNSKPNQDMLKLLASGSTVSKAGVGAEAVQHKAPFMRQFDLLAARALKNTWRNPLIIRGKATQTLVLALVIGLIFLQVGDDQAGIQDRTGSLFFVVVQGLFGTVFGTLSVFGTEKPVFKREYTSRMYSLPAFYFSRWLVQMPQHIIFPFLASCIVYWMIGFQEDAGKFFTYCAIVIAVEQCGAAMGIFVSCLFNDISVAMTFMPLFLLPLMVFSGFFVNAESLGWYFRWISYVSPMKYGYIALVKNEFEGLKLDCQEGEACPQGYRPGEDTITALGFDSQGYIFCNAIMLVILWALFMAMGYLALTLSVRRLTKA